jgi:diguanylate cyclase (GGDEF)-like protein
MNAPGAALVRYVTVGVVGIAVYFLLPPAAQNLAIVASNLLALGVILGCWRRRRLTPTSGWLLLAAFPAATAVGNTVYFINDSIRHVQPFPSVGDAAFLCGYLFLAAGLLRLQRARSTQRDFSAVLDTGIITVGFAAASWVVFMGDLLHDNASSLFERVTAVGYPVADVLVLAVAARFFLTSHRRGPVFGWLAGTVVVMLAADTAFAVLNLLDVYSTGHPVDALILAYNLGWGAVALHRDAHNLTMPPPNSAARLTRWRLAALTSASLIPPGVLVVQVLTGDMWDALVTACAAALLFLLVVARMAALVRALETVIAQRQALESELEHRAHHDELTGLANRRMFGEQVQRALYERAATRVLFLDLDRFKAVNDSLGHSAGDTLLITTARRLRTALHPTDTVARLGGDEFAVLLGDQTGARSLEDVCEALAASVMRPVPIQGLDVQISVSIGAAEALPGDTLEDLVHRADTAMYAQKARTDRRANATTLPSVSADSATAPRGSLAR